MRQRKHIALAAVCALALTITGCANVPSSPETLAGLSGSYEVVDQAAPKALELTQIDVRFVRDKSGIAFANVRLTNGNYWQDFTYLNCGYPGDRIANSFAQSDKPGASEVIRCQVPQPRGPVMFIVRSLDGHPLSFARGGGLISAIINKPVVSTTGMKIVLNWGPDTSAGFAVRRIPDAVPSPFGDVLPTAE